MKIKTVNKHPIAKGIFNATQTGAKVFGLVKGAYETFKTVQAVAQTAAPYVRALAAVV